MNSLRWRIALWFTVSLLAVAAVFVAVTDLHLRHELRVEKWERTEPGQADWTLHGSYSEAEVDDIAGELWRLSLLYALPVTLLAIAVGYHLARRAFAPVAEMNAQLQFIGARSLDHRVRLTHADAEFRAIEENVNQLLVRLDTSFRQLSEFSAQVAHELRTPLTLLRLQVEEAAGRIEPGLAEAMQEELRRLSDYVDQSLLLATAEQGRLALNLAPVGLRDLVMDMIEVYELLARTERRTITVVAPEECSVLVDSRRLRQILHNLLTNALRHGTGPIVVSVMCEGGVTLCRVDNALADRASLAGAERGLGLRIVRALVALHPRLSFSTQLVDGRFLAELSWR